MAIRDVGLIQNESQEAIDLVKNMVVSYIDRPNTLILVAMPITGECVCTSIVILIEDSLDDVENQQAARLAREADPEGVRTIGELTSVVFKSKKSDRILLFIKVS